VSAVTSAIQKGKVKVTVVSEQGKEAVVAILGTNEFFGEGCLGAQVQRFSRDTLRRLDALAKTASFPVRPTKATRDVTSINDEVERRYR
jgi:hypothetical protein